MSVQKQSEACSLAALILSDADKEFSASNITTLAKAAGVDVLPVIADSFSKSVTKDSLRGLIDRLTKVGGGAPASTSAPSAPSSSAAKEPEPESSSSEGDVGFGDLF